MESPFRGRRRGYEALRGAIIWFGQPSVGKVLTALLALDGIIEYQRVHWWFMALPLHGEGLWRVLRHGGDMGRFGVQVPS